MKKSLLAGILLYSAVLGSAQMVTLNFVTGILSDQNGNPIADGSLFQVIASPDAVFDAPTPDAFFGGNDILVYSGGFDSSILGLPGATQLSLAGLSLSEFPIAQYNLAIRWFPALSDSSSVPGFATFYGEYGYGMDSSWVAPSSGGIANFEFVTVSGGGEIPDSAGSALNQTAPIPEPSTYAAIIGVLALGLVAYRRRFASAA